MELRLQTQSPTTEVMADLTVQNEGVKRQKAALDGTSEKTNPVRSAYFKYYIHDAVECCRLQLIGELRETDLPDLTGCWNTVKTTIANRKFVLDLQGLRGTDDAAKQWIIRMAAEGAALRPENFLNNGSAAEASRTRARTSFLSKLLSLFRGSPAIQA
jgi:hypothetical protein